MQDIPGWLRREDILKLYEVAYFSPGPILEIGCYHGKSTVVMARALANRTTAVPFFSLDVDPVALRAASRSAVEHGVGDRVLFVRGRVHACFRVVPDRRPTMVFIDGDHSRRGVLRDLAGLRAAVPDGAILLFHDYHDPGNADPSNKELGVVEAVAESWVAMDCDFGGVFGCGALASAAAHRPPRQGSSPGTSSNCSPEIAFGCSICSACVGRWGHESVLCNGDGAEAADRHPGPRVGPGRA